MSFTPIQKFRISLDYFIKKEGRGIQTKISNKTGINLVYLNDIIKGRKPGSEEVRERIANYFGFTYEKFLEFGAWLLQGKDPDEWFMLKKSQKEQGVKIPPIMSKIVGLLLEMEEEDLKSVYQYALDKATLRRLEKKVQGKRSQPPLPEGRGLRGKTCRPGVDQGEP